MDLLQLLALVRRNVLTLIAALLVGLGLGAGVSYLQPVLYSATSSGFVVTGGGSELVTDAFERRNLAEGQASTYLALVGSRSVAETVAEEMGLSAAEVYGSLQGSTEAAIFRITATASDPDLAAEMADTAIQVTSEAANDLETMTISGESTGKTVLRIVPFEPARVPSDPISPNWTRNLVLGLMLGLLGGFGLVVLRHTLDRRVREALDVEEITGSSALGIIPWAEELAENRSLTRNRGAAAEALRLLRTNLRFVSVDNPPRSIVVTSANPGEGKSTISAQLASLLAEAGQPTVLIDADLRRPRLATYFGVDATVGLTQVVAGSVELADAIMPTTQENLLFLPAGRVPPNPSEIVGSHRMRDLIESLSREYTVIIDAPPLLPVTDAGLLSGAADGTVLVVRHSSTRKEHVTLATNNLARVGGTLLGFVINQVPKAEMGSAAYGYSYSGYSSQYYYYYYESGRRGGASDSGARRKRPSRRAMKRAESAALAALPAGTPPEATPSAKNDGRRGRNVAESSRAPAGNGPESPTFDELLRGQDGAGSQSVRA